MLWDLYWLFHKGWLRSQRVAWSALLWSSLRIADKFRMTMLIKECCVASQWCPNSDKVCHVINSDWNWSREADHWPIPASPCKMEQYTYIRIRCRPRDMSGDNVTYMAFHETGWIGMITVALSKSPSKPSPLFPSLFLSNMLIEWILLATVGYMNPSKDVVKSDIECIFNGVSSQKSITKKKKKRKNKHSLNYSHRFIIF